MTASNEFFNHSRSVFPLVSSCLITLGLTIVSDTGALAQSAPPLTECNEFAESVNRNQVIMANFEAEIADFTTNASAAETLDEITAAASQYVEAVDQVTDNLTVLADELRLLAFTDPQLQDYRDGYVAVLTGFNTALDTVNAAMSNVATVETEADLAARLETVASDTATAIEQIESLAVEESNLIDNVNNHCGVE